MTKIKLFFLLLFSCTLGYSQTSQDSLFAIWKDVKLQDTTRLYAFEDYIYEGYNTKYRDSAIVLWNELIAFAENVGADDYHTSALITNGYNYFQLGKYPEAINSYKEAIEITEKTKQVPSWQELLE